MISTWKLDIRCSAILIHKDFIFSLFNDFQKLVTLITKWSSELISGRYATYYKSWIMLCLWLKFLPARKFSSVFNSCKKYLSIFVIWFYISRYLLRQTYFSFHFVCLSSNWVFMKITASLELNWLMSFIYLDENVNFI